ncbi:MAG: hypothetical protein ACRDOO_22410, partial [Actinomadura sp.]
ILIGSYEGQIAPVVPLLLKDMDMTLTTYGAVSATAALVVAGYFTYLMGLEHVSIGHLTVTAALLGGALGLTYAVWMANYSEDAEDAEDIDPRLQGTAWGVYGFLTKATALVTLLVVPRVVEAASWQAWLLIAVVCLAFFIPAVFLFNGPWRRPASAVSGSSHLAGL